MNPSEKLGVAALAVALLFRAAFGCGSSGVSAEVDAAPKDANIPDVDAARADSGPRDGGGKDGGTLADAGQAPDVIVPPFDAGPILGYDDFGCTPAPVVASCANGSCLLPKGCFVMGSPDDVYGRAAYGEDIHRVDFTHDVRMDDAEMTLAAWNALGLPATQHDQNPQAALPCVGTPAECPVTNVSFFDGLAAANARSAAENLPACYLLSGCTGTVGTDYKCTGVATTTAKQADCTGYRLPTRAEFEYAARAGVNGPLPGGEFTNPRDECYDEPNLRPWAWYCIDGNRLHPIKQKRANGFGLYDIFGNAGEWLFDDGAPHAIPSQVTDPQLDFATSQLRIQAVVRVGFVTAISTYMDGRARTFSGSPSTRDYGIGVRFVRSVIP